MKTVLATLGALLLIGGCATADFPGGQLPRVGSVSLALADKPSAVLLVGPRDVVAVTDNMNWTKTWRSWQVEFKEIVNNVTEASGLFRSFAINPAEGQVPEADYTIHMGLKIEPARIGEFYQRLVVSTLGALPAVGTARFTLSADVIDRTGSLLKSYVLEDSMTTTIHPVMLLIFWGLPGPGATASGIVENMVKTLYRDIVEEGFLRGS